MHHIQPNLIIDDVAQDLPIEITSDAFANTVNSSENIAIRGATLTIGSLSITDLRLETSGGLAAPAGQTLTLDVDGDLTVARGANP